MKLLGFDSFPATCSPVHKRDASMQRVKHGLQHTLKGLGLDQRLRASYIHDFYQATAHRRAMERRSREIEFYRGLLNGFRRGDLIFDVGANVGDKTDVFLRLGARTVAIEPNEACQEVLKAKFLRYRLAPKPVVVVAKAVSDKETVETIWIDGPESALNTLNPKWVTTIRDDPARFATGLDRLEFREHKEIQTITLEQLILTHGCPFFVKVDTEGYELNVLRGLLRPVPYVSFEVNLPEFRPEGLQCVELLGHLSADGQFNYTVDCHRLVLQEWLKADAFLRILGQCMEKSIEVCWRSLAVER